MASLVRNTARRLYISNIPWTASSEQLIDFFRKFGEVTNAVVLFDKDTGFSKNYGYLDFVDSKFLTNIEKVHKHELEGKILHLSMVEDKVKTSGDHVEN